MLQLHAMHTVAGWLQCSPIHLGVYFKGALTGKRLRNTDIEEPISPFSSCSCWMPVGARGGEAGGKWRNRFLYMQPPTCDWALVFRHQAWRKGPCSGVRGALHGFLHRGPEGSSYASVFLSSCLYSYFTYNLSCICAGICWVPGWMNFCAHVGEVTSTRVGNEDDQEEAA